VENFSELNEESTRIEFGTVREVIKAFSIYADCCSRLAEGMVKEDREKQARRKQLEEVPFRLPPIETLSHLCKDCTLNPKAQALNPCIYLLRVNMQRLCAFPGSPRFLAAR
jgi:hypothetical protein